MGFKSREIEGRLTNKFAFTQDTTHESGHKWFVLQLPGLPAVRTMLSHGAKEIGPGLEAMMARQLRVSGRFFREMIACTKSKDDYYEALRANPKGTWDPRIR